MNGALSMVWKNVEVFVIGAAGELRSQSLKVFLETLDGRIPVNYVSPYFPTEPEILMVNKITAGHYSGGLSSGEVGCSIAHLKAQIKASQSGAGICLFLEDDALVPDSFESSLGTIIDFLANALEPRGISLFTGEVRQEFVLNQTTLETLTFTEFQPGVFPSGTVAYLLNSQAIQLAVDFAVGKPPLPAGKADFPVWAQRVTWHVTTPNLVQHPDVDSTMLDRRIQKHRALDQIWLLTRRFAGLFLDRLDVPLKDRIRWEFAEFFYAVKQRLHRP